MPYNSNQVFRPDFEAPQMAQTQWQPMGESEPLNVTPFVDALKQRMNQPMLKQGATAAAAGKASASASGGGSGGGAPQSL